MIPLALGEISQRPVGEIIGSLGIEAAVAKVVYRARLRVEVSVSWNILVLVGWMVSCGGSITDVGISMERLLSADAMRTGVCELAGTGDDLHGRDVGA